MGGTDGCGVSLLLSLPSFLCFSEQQGRDKEGEIKGEYLMERDKSHAVNAAQ